MVRTTQMLSDIFNKMQKTDDNKLNKKIRVLLRKTLNSRLTQ